MELLLLSLMAVASVGGLGVVGFILWQAWRIDPDTHPVRSAEPVEDVREKLYAEAWNAYDGVLEAERALLENDPERYRIVETIYGQWAVEEKIVYDPSDWRSRLYSRPPETDLIKPIWQRISPTFQEHVEAWVWLIRVQRRDNPEGDYFDVSGKKVRSVKHSLAGRTSGNALVKLNPVDGEL